MKYLPLLIAILLWACDQDNSSKKTTSPTLDISNFVVLSQTKIGSDTLFVEVVDSLDYFNEILLKQKVELSTYDRLLEDTTILAVKVSLNMPNREEAIVNHELMSDKLVDMIRYKHEIAKYRAFIPKLIERINTQNNDYILDEMNSKFALAVYKETTKEKAPFGLNALDVIFKRMAEMEPEKSQFKVLLEAYKHLSLNDGSELGNTQDALLEFLTTEVENN